MRERLYDHEDITRVCADYRRKLASIRNWIATRSEMSNPDDDNTLLVHVQWLLDQYERAEADLGRAKPIADRATAAIASAKAAKVEIATMQQLVDRVTCEIETKTQELRRLNAERDPDRVAKLVADAVTVAMAQRDATIAKLRSDIGSRDSEITELRAAKKKLREAIERLKEGRAS